MLPAFPRGALRVLPLLCLLAACRTSPGSRETVEAAGGAVSVAAGSLAPGTGRFHSYRSPTGGRADFLVYRESGGEPRAVLDACADCYRWRKGYRLGEGRVVCVKCGMGFALDELRSGFGACVPIPLSAAPRGDRLVMPQAELDAATRYF